MSEHSKDKPIIPILKMLNFQISIWVGLIFALLAAFFDLRTRKIPNLLTFPTIVLSLLVRLALSFSVQNFEYLKEGLLGFGVGLLIFMPFFVLRMGVGAGDLKLLGALGALVGYKAFFWIFAFTTIWDGILIIGRWLTRMYPFLVMPAAPLEKIIKFVEYLRTEKRSQKNPYALPVGLGCLSFIGIYYFARTDLEIYFGDFFRFD
ncbi:MAG: prepilin peptidase [Candidatus Caenarcaniphilales bacterium]|nr:prepilin peptidase [Candidatus Caenarcaniphilales bacterium]